jgi:hypothetical protein
MAGTLGLFRGWPFSSEAKIVARHCDCFQVSTPSGAWLVAEKGANRSAKPIATLQAAPFSERLILCIPEYNRQVGCFLPPGGGGLCVRGDAYAGAAVSVRFEGVEGVEGSGKLRFVHPLNLHWRLVAGQGAEISFAHQDACPSADFCLVQVDNALMPTAKRQDLQEIAASASVPERWEPMLAAIRNRALRPGLAEALLRCLPLDELQSLSDHLTRSRADLRLLRAILPQDLWLAARFDRLLAWRNARDASPRRARNVTRNETADLPGATGFTAHRPSLGHTLHALARRNTQPRRMACALASARNEGPYVLDWIAYHRSIGFDHVFIYTNDNTDGSDDLLDRLARAGTITWLRNELGPHSLPQIRSYAHALSVLPDILDYRWTLIADLDEFFAFERKKYTSVTDFLAWHDSRRTSSIALPWLLHVADPHDAWHDAPSIARFPKREETINHHIKTIFRTNLFWNANAHHPEPAMGLPVSTRVETGHPHRPKAPENNPALTNNPTANQAWIAHYIFRSAPEALMKIMRGKGDRPRADRQADLASMIRPFIALSTRRPLVDDARIAACAAGMAAEHARLSAIPGVQACDAAIKQKFARHMADACAEFVRLPAPVGREDWAAFRSILLRQSQNVLFDSRVA